MLRAMFAPQGPTVRELAVQALSSVERGYDLLAPKFDHTPFRTPEAVLTPVSRVLRRLGPFGSGLDLCCGTGAGMASCAGVPGAGHRIDISAGMLAEGRAGEPVTAGAPRTEWVRADARALPFGPVFDLAVSFGAFGHFLPRERPGLFAQVHSVLRPGGGSSSRSGLRRGPGRAATGRCWLSTWRCGSAMRCGGRASSCTTGRSASPTCVRS